jgi:hypothetical protein
MLVPLGDCGRIYGMEEARNRINSDESSSVAGREREQARLGWWDIMHINLLYAVSLAYFSSVSLSLVFECPYIQNNGYRFPFPIQSTEAESHLRLADSPSPPSSPTPSTRPDHRSHTKPQEGAMK